VERTLRYLGLAVLAASAWILLAGEFGWVDASTSDAWFGPLFKIGGVCFVAGAVLTILAPGLRRMRRGRCARCGVAIESGQSLCLDHLRATVNEARDQIHDRAIPAARRR
jgi:hypothetical protein